MAGIIDTNLMKRQFVKFLIRWFTNGGGLYVAAKLFDLLQYQNRLSVIVIASFILSILNILIKPILVIFTLPAIALTLGIFMILINGFMIVLVGNLYGNLQVTSFWAAVLVGMVIGLINYIMTILLESFEKRHA